MNLNGEFYGVKKEEYDSKTSNCIVESMEKLALINEKPLMLLGKIQSGKTKAFIGLISLVFDNGYDLAVILTKNSNALAKQTVARLQMEFSEFKEDDILDIFDIMCIPKEMSKFELEKKLIIVVKKEKNNLPRMIDFIEKYSLAVNKKCLIIDDEADFCSIGYEKKKEVEEYDLRRIASQINNLRSNIECRFVQVTATPYSLYLQPDVIEINGDKKIEPIKPAETVLVPFGDAYIGGNYYFDKEINPLNDYLFYAIDEDELKVIKAPDRRRLKKENSLISEKISGIRNAIVNFLVGGCMRILQNGGRPKGKNNRFSFIVHTEIAKASHQNQEEIIINLLDQMQEEVGKDSSLINGYLKDSYNLLSKSVKAYNFMPPEFDDVKTICYKAILDEWITKSIVNSENDINSLLDDSGQLRLRTPLNIFIGGQILDRGITISNLIGFYYGRSPRKMQQDTVLQHARMYGYRKKEDLAVTKLYTTRPIYLRMVQINEFDRQLRKDFEEGNFERGIICISQDSSGKIIPCSPNKLLISNTHVLKGGGTILPVGFNSGYKTNIYKDIEFIDKALSAENMGELAGRYTISLDKAIDIINHIYNTLEFEVDNYVTGDQMIAMLQYLATDRVNIYCAINRKITRLRETSRYYSDMPYSRSGDLTPSKEFSQDRPTLMLMKQCGRKNEGWRDTEFYWPILVVPKNIRAAVYTSECV